MPDGELPLALTILRLVRRWNQDDLARASGIRNSSISDYERGKKMPELKTLHRLVGTMGYSLSTLDQTQRFVAALGRAAGSEDPRPGESPGLPSSSDESELRDPDPLALRWELEQASAEAGRAISRVTRLLLLLLTQPPGAPSPLERPAEHSNDG